MTTQTEDSLRDTRFATARPAERTPLRATRRRALALALALVASAFALTPTTGAGAQQTEPTLSDTARLLGYLWADGSYDNGVWDATGPSGGSEIIQRLVISHGGTWVNRPQLRFTLPQPYDWAEWKNSLPNDDARTRQAVRNPNFLAAVLEGEGSSVGLVYDQSSCCTAGFTSGRLTGLLALLQSRGFTTASVRTFADSDSGEVTIDASEFVRLRVGHEFLCPATGSAIRVPGAEDYATYGPIRWFSISSRYTDVVRTDCELGQPVQPIGPPAGDCVVTSEGNGELRVTWTFLRGTVAVRRDNTFLSAVSALNHVLVDRPASGRHTYTVRVTSDGLRTDRTCGTASTTDARVAPPTPGQSCFGRAITHMGTGERDIIDGTAGVDVIHGYGGNDLLRGFGKDDMICGGSGNDRIRGGYGNDRIRGGDGNDRIDAGAGADLVRAGNGADIVYGRRGPDSLDGEGGNDILRAGDGFDQLIGGTGDDLLIGGKHRDTCDGGPGTNRVRIDCEG